jgi:hypothetical protein
VHGNLLAQRIAVQVVRRSIVNLRPFLSTPKLESAKARGFIARGLLGAHAATQDVGRLDQAIGHLDWLVANQSSEFAGCCWGNQFDFASRGGYYPEGLPTVVWSTLIGEAFLRGYGITGDEGYARVVHGVAEFVFECLERHEDENGVCIAYAPGVMNLVHNSNLLGALSLVRSWSLGGEREYLEIAERSVAWTLTNQMDNGSWSYGVGNKYGWVDNFHTAYCLDSLREIGTLAPQLEGVGDALERGFRFWVESFFLDDGTPRYYADKTYPIDIQCCAQAIETLAKWADVDPVAADKMWPVGAWTLEHMLKRNGSFRFRINRLSRNELESLHWGESTMLSALGCLLCSERIDATRGEMA